MYPHRATYPPRATAALVIRSGALVLLTLLTIAGEAKGAASASRTEALAARERLSEEARELRIDAASRRLGRVVTDGDQGPRPSLEIRVAVGLQSAWKILEGKEPAPGKKMRSAEDLLEAAKNGTAGWLETEELQPREREAVVEVLAKSGRIELARKLRDSIAASTYIEAKDLLAQSNALDKLVSEMPSFRDRLYTTIALNALSQRENGYDNDEWDDPVDYLDADDKVRFRQVKEQESAILDQLELLANNSLKIVLNAWELDGHSTVTINVCKSVIGGVESIRSHNYRISELSRIVSTACQGVVDDRRVMAHLAGAGGDNYVKWASMHDAEVSTVQDARHARAYADLTRGTQWRDEQLDALVTPQGNTPQQLRQQIIALSARNVETLRKELVPFAPGEQELYDAIVATPWTLKHSTGAYHAIVNSGELLSLTALADRGAKQKASGFSSENNILYKGDGGFVFFRFDVGDGAMETRYGPTTIVADAKATLARAGWVSLHDQLYPLDRPTMQRLQDSSEVWRTSEHPLERRGAGKQTRWLNTYPMNSTQKPVNVSFVEEVFVGDDIMPGIALSVLRELRRIGGSYRVSALQKKTPSEVAFLVSRLFRVEAKLPWSWLYRKSSATKVINPDGDGRYLASGLSRLEGLAAGAAYDACKRKQSIIDNMQSDYQATKAPETLNRLSGFLKEDVTCRQNALSAAEEFLKVVSGDEQVRDIARQVVEQRKKELQQAQESLKVLK